MTRSLTEIAVEILNDWKEPYFGAVPYILAMLQIDSVEENYGADSGVSIVLYFLSNAATWRGETAKRVKAELRAMVKGK